jgi:hypothetical protein
LVAHFVFATSHLEGPARETQDLEAGMSNPMVGRFSALADEYLRFRPIAGLYCHSEYLGRKVREVDDFSWSGVDLQQAAGGTAYPQPQSPA